MTYRPAWCCADGVPWAKSMLVDYDQARIAGFAVRTWPTGMWMATRKGLRTDGCGADEATQERARAAAVYCVRWFVRRGRWPRRARPPWLRPWTLTLRRRP